MKMSILRMDFFTVDLIDLDAIRVKEQGCACHTALENYRILSLNIVLFILYNRMNTVRCNERIAI